MYKRQVLRESLPAGAEETFINVNDGTCEGITYRDIPAFTVQFHPEACAGPKDTEELFGRFIKMMEKYKEEEMCIRDRLWKERLLQNCGRTGRLTRRIELEGDRLC